MLNPYRPIFLRIGPIAFYLQATDSRGLKTSTTHANLSDDHDLKNWATIPTPKLEQDFYDWYRRHADALRIKDSIDPKIVLLGDSITHMWGGRPTETKHQTEKTLGRRCLATPH